MKNKFIYLAIIAVGFASCEPEFEKEVGANYSSGEADFTSYVAIGNSLTAGYMDGTVSRVGQTYSYPNLLAQQFALVGGGAFTQPSYAEDVNNLGGIQGLTGTRLVINASVGGVQPIAGTPTITLTPQAMAYNNMGVPGAKSFHLLAPGYGSAANLLLGRANPYFVRHATSTSATVIGDAMTKNPTFFTNWIGANDVLAYATSGGTMPDNPLTTTVDESVMSANDHNTTGNINPLTYGPNDITNTNLYESTYRNMINTLTNGGAKGVVCTIPSVTSIPYFTTVPFAPLSPTALGGATTIATLNAQLYGPLDAIFTALGEPNRVNPLSATSANPILIFDADALDRTAQITGALSGTLGVPTATAFGMVFGKARQATAADLVVLTARSVIGTPNASSPSPLININGVSYPMANKWVLTATEKTKVANATTAYNASIRSIAATKNLAVADMNTIMIQLVSGLRIETGQVYTANYFSGSATEGLVLFSLDGVHPNARGYAVITNEIIKVINAHYKSNLPLHNPSYFPGINIVGSN
ncbi:G-D-S-L family lipolytic protein [Flavobacterium sp.]|jgi:lysophospholipase L1-like esterase|uniref:G-D-S-L family lipolytic protein n=1 Tax=Flavobacterium sp. TaxID=239 RepID=UPI0037BEF8E7